MDAQKDKPTAKVVLEETWGETTYRWHKHLEDCRTCGFESNFCPEGKRLRLENKDAYQALKRFEASA